VVDAAAPRAGVIASLIETTKPGITRLVTITSFVGYVMAAAGWRFGDGAPGRWFEWQLVLSAAGCIVGTALAAAGANALNQWMERDRDAVMPRTVRRPLPQGRVSAGLVLGVGSALCFLGCGLLWAINGYVPALVAVACVVSYVAMYTPMKTRSALSTFVGAIPGALPPLIGWSAGSSENGFATLTDWGGLSLFILMFVWQIPHFLAIAWMYRDDYAKGGYVVLPVIDPKGSWTATTILLWTVALVPATLLPAVVMPALLGIPYLTVACVSALAFLALAARLVKNRGRSDARVVFFASIIHLPLILMVMVGEAAVRTFF